MVPCYREWDGQGSLTSFVISLNNHRRHLTSTQKTFLAKEAHGLFAEEARERMSIGGQGGAGKVASHDATPEVGKSAKFAAEATGASQAQLERLLRVDRNAPELVEEVTAHCVIGFGRH